MLRRNGKNIVRLLPVTLVLGLLFSSPVLADGWDKTSKASNRDSILNTRHNLTQSYVTGGFAVFMDYSRNNYGEVCVYCHTPHGASSVTTAPLWNRTINTGSYELFSLPLMSGQSPIQPQSPSLSCLSCHDGTIAIDSIINMPGSSRYNQSQETAQNNDFLDSWTSPSGIQTVDHGVIASADNISFLSGPYNCNRCHTTGNMFGIADFEIFNIGTDLRDDHPIGVTLPEGTSYDFKVDTGLISGKFKYFDDSPSNNKLDKNELRLYFDGLSDYRVECASCHDPHGVAPTAGAEMYPSFLRRSNASSAVCLTCHIK